MTVKNASEIAKYAAEYWKLIIANANPELNKTILNKFKTCLSSLIAQKIRDFSDKDYLWIRSSPKTKNGGENLIKVALVNSGITMFLTKPNVPTHYSMGICRDYISVSEGQAEPYKVIFGYSKYLCPYGIDSDIYFEADTIMPAT